MIKRHTCVFRRKSECDCWKNKHSLSECEHCQDYEYDLFATLLNHETLVKAASFLAGTGLFWLLCSIK